MRLHRVRLCNYRGVADCEVPFSTEGITVVEGPNEVGKTSISEGLDLLLEFQDSSHHRRVVSVKPVGGDVGPEVEVEMSSGQYRFVYRKRWLRRGETTLEIVAPRHEQFSGRDAHDEVDRILDETLDRQLWRALRVEQGTELALPVFDVPSLVTALDRAAANSSTAADEDDDLWTRICEERERYWTPTGRPKGDRKAQQRGVERARLAVDELKQQLDAMESDAAEVRRLGNEAMRLAATREECERREFELSEAWAAAEQLRHNVERLAAAHEAADAKRNSFVGEQERRQELIDALNSRANELRVLESQAQQSGPALAAALHEGERTRADLERAQAALQAAEADQRRSSEDRDHHRRQIEVEQLQERYDRVVDAERTLSNAEAQLASAKVDDELLAEIDQAHLAVVRAEAAIASVETTALRALSMRIDCEQLELAAGKTQRTVVDDEVVLMFPDVAEVRVRAGAGSRSLAAERRSAHDALRRVCERGGVADLSEARAAAERRREAKRQRSEALATIERDLRDLTVDVLDTKIKGLTRQIASYAADRPDDPPVPSDFEEAKKAASATDRIVAELRDGFENCNHAAAEADSALSNEQIKEADLNGQIKHARESKQAAVDRLAAARHKRADAAIAEDLATVTREADASRRLHEKAEADLAAANPESLRIRRDNAGGAAQRARDELQSNDRSQNELRVSLSVRGEEGLHTQHDEAVRRLRHLEREYRRADSKAETARLLHKAFEQRRREARERYGGPFKDRIEQFGSYVFNSTFAVELDKDLRIVRRTLDGDTLGVDQLSTGAREQLGVLSRLACAAIVSPDGGGAPVIIDDALGWSDPDRLERMGAAIAAAGRKCQLVILTCTPGRYAHIGNATTIQLPNRP